MNDAQDDRLELTVATRRKDACHIRILAPIWLADNFEREGIVEEERRRTVERKAPHGRGLWIEAGIKGKGTSISLVQLAESDRGEP